MSHHKRLPLLALLATVAIAFAACSSAATTAPTAAPATEAPTTAPTAAPTTTPTEAPTTAPTEAPYTGMVYPETGEVDCAAKTFNGKDYTGMIKSIKAVDAKTVEFTLCGPDPAFLSKVAFSPFAINDTAYLEKAAADGSIVRTPNGTGPYMVKEWVQGDHITLVANPTFWGEAPKVSEVVFKWSTEAAQRLVELQSGNADGIDNPGPTDFDTIKNDPNLKLYPREGLNVFYVGMNNTYPPFDNEKVRQAVAMGIDRQRIVDNFMPPGSVVASHFTPCSVPNGCTGPEWYPFDVTAAKALLTEAGYPDGFKTKIHLRDVVRGYLAQPVIVAQDIQAQLKKNLGIDAEIDIQESGTYIDNADAGKLDGIHLLGWGADYPDITNFLDYHFGPGSSAQFGDKYPDIVAALQEGAIGASDDARKPAYEKANEYVKQHVPMVPISHAGSATAFKADVEGAHSSPLTSEMFSVMKPGDRTQLVWIQNGEPAGIYCADETDGEALRVCEQVTESLYGFEIAGTKAIPVLATECKPNADLSAWTCTLRDGVTFADGATLDANDVVLSYAVQWDAAHPLHKGRDGSFTYFPSLWGGFLNPPPPAE
jgi:peptide/nickel transport system substrate-binding protein